MICTDQVTRLGWYLRNRSNSLKSSQFKIHNLFVSLCPLPFSGSIFVSLGLAVWCEYLVIVVIGSEGLRKPKVTDFGELLVDQQDVTCCQVSVHKVLLFQILHSHWHLVHQVDNVLHTYSIPVGTKILIMTKIRRWWLFFILIQIKGLRIESVVTGSKPWGPMYTQGLTRWFKKNTYIYIFFFFLPHNKL